MADTSASPRHESARPGLLAATLSWLGQALPTAVVLVVLGGVAVWGHHTGWRWPGLSAAPAASAEPNDWCAEHNVPESICVECKPELLPHSASRWCQKHGVYDCPTCYPAVAQLNEPPQLPRYDTLAALSLIERPENNRHCKLHLHHIQFASQEAVEKAGIEVELVQEQPMTEAIATPGEINYDPTHVARLSARVPGSVWRVTKKVGDPVKDGEILALIDAAEVGRAKADLLQTLVQHRLKVQTLEGLRSAASSGALPERQLRDAETALSEARLRLLGAQQALVNLGLPVDPEPLRALPEDQLAARIQFLGLPADLAATLDPRTTSANLLPVKAPLDGLVVTREVVAGEVVDSARALFVVADVRRMELTLDVPLEEARRLVLGQPVRFQPDGAPTETAGRLSWISTAVDDHTRTVKVRADLDNRDGNLRAHTFGPGRIVLRAEPNAVVVPKEAVHWEGCCHVVFVRDKDFLRADTPKLFHVRMVRIGARDDKCVEVLAGLLPGEWVAAQGSAVLRAQLLKSRLGAG